MKQFKVGARIEGAIQVFLVSAPEINTHEQARQLVRTAYPHAGAILVIEKED